MRAVTVSQFGSQPVVSDVPKPKPGPGQILIKVRAAGVNPMDRSLASGAWKPMPVTFPFILGSDVAGVVDEIGTGESRFHRGDEVFGQLMIAPLGSAGTYAEYVAVAADAPLACVPDALDAMVAASLPTAGATALQIVDALSPLDSRTVLIVGAAGGVGSFLTQFVSQAGAHVIAAVRASENDRVRGYGAAETIDYLSEPVASALRRSHPDGVDVLIDVASDAPAFAALAALVRRGGTAVTTKYVADAAALGAAGITAVNFAAKITNDTLARLGDAVASGRIVPPPIRRVSLADAPALWNPEAGRHRDGKTVITP